MTTSSWIGIVNITVLTSFMVWQFTTTTPSDIREILAIKQEITTEEHAAIFTKLNKIQAGLETYNEWAREHAKESTTNNL